MTTLGILTVLIGAGCGYTAGFKMPEGLDTIHVKVLENRTFHRDLDFELTQLLKREILSRTDLTVVRENKADVVLSCSVDEVQKSILQEDENDLPQEVEYMLTVSANARNRSGKVLFSAPSLRRSVRYVVAVGEDEKTARGKALKEVARELIYRIAESWAWRKDEDEKPDEKTEKEPEPGSE